jgi:hypothetical protein
MTAIATRIMRFLPNISARRDNVGIATAPAASVAVTSHDALSGAVCSIR